MAGGGAKRKAKRAAFSAEQEAGRLKEQTDILKKRTEATALKSQRILLRALRSRGGGFFETDSAAAAPADSSQGLGSTGSLN